MRTKNNPLRDFGRVETVLGCGGVDSRGFPLVGAACTAGGKLAERGSTGAVPGRGKPLADGIGPWADGIGPWADGIGPCAEGICPWADGIGPWPEA